jgi:hypothetical protein
MLSGFAFARGAGFAGRFDGLFIGALDGALSGPGSAVPVTEEVFNGEIAVCFPLALAEAGRAKAFGGFESAAAGFGCAASGRDFFGFESFGCFSGLPGFVYGFIQA